MMERHIGDTNTMRWVIYHVHRTLAAIRYARRQTVIAQRFAAAKIRGQTYIDRYIEAELLRIKAV